MEINETKEKVFYGLWSPKLENIQTILETGKWINRLSNEAGARRQIASIELGTEVFLYQGIKRVKYKDTPFSDFVASKTQEQTTVYVKSFAIGNVKSKDIENKLLIIDWQKNYKEKTWYTYYRQDGVWTFNLSSQVRHQKLFYQKLYEIVFEDKEQDAKWWIENGFMNTYLQEEKNQESEKDMSLNQILYGPPGTGKTYNTINRALEIIDGEVSEDRSEAKARFEALSSAGQIEFVTFHQSYGYEEFVEGIKASTIDGNISYDVEGGVFKKLCIKSQEKGFFFLGQIIGKYKIVSFTTELLKLQRQSGTIIPIPMYILNEIFDLLEKNVLSTNDLNNKTAIDKMSPTTEKYIVNGYPNVFRDLALYYLEKKQINKSNLKNYILIIDEINRGNISKIFGELITLIEPSKRLGAEDEIRLRLPYSNELFGVPSNLYIIGTMNTADRSIALMDTALRRRFEFVEMMPNVDLLNFEVAGVNLKELLEKINVRVEYLYDRDHTIGHAYFMELHVDSTLADLNAVMKNKIIPLLQEYFYDDWEKIVLILNEGFISRKTLNSEEIFAKSIDDEYIEEDKFLYSVVEEFEYESYMSLCQNR